MQDYGIVAIIMGGFALGIGLFFGIMIHIIHKNVKHKVQTDEQIQKMLHDAANDAIKNNTNGHI